MIDGVPLLAVAEQERERRVAPALGELLHAMEDGADGEAVAAFCRSHECARSPYSADWKFFFSVPDGGTTLELGSGVGEDIVDLAGRGGTTISVVPSLTNARIVRRHLQECPARDWPMAVLTDLTGLPLPDGSVHAIALEDAAAPGFGLSRRNFPAVAAEWKRVFLIAVFVVSQSSTPHPPLGCAASHTLRWRSATALKFWTNEPNWSVARIRISTMHRLGTFGLEVGRIVFKTDQFMSCTERVGLPEP